MTRRDVSREHHGELSVRALEGAGPEAAFDLRDVIEAHWPVRGWQRQPADVLRVAPLILEDADLDGILLLPFLIKRDAIITSDRQAQHVADGFHPHAQISSSPTVDAHVHV